MSKDDVLKKVREILSKDKNFDSVEVEVIFNDKKKTQKKDKKRCKIQQ